jgi:hypothetical protein
VLILASKTGKQGPDETIVLGAEYDARLRAALTMVLKELGAQDLSASWSLAGSQELQQMDVDLGNEIISIELETYVGLSIRGTPELVNRIANSVRVCMRNA